MATVKKVLLIAVATLVMGTLFVLPASAGDSVLSINKGTTSTTWFISGEPSLVMNGFDLSKAGVALPVVVDRVSITVRTPVPGTPIQVVVYQDANGGSPVDAALIGSAVVDIQRAGVFTATLNQPAVVTQPVVWVGFYLPVGFKFLADKSGTSVLTYWAWRNGTSFDLGKLASADVLGPADGSAPVNLDMKGIARITAQISAAPGAQVTAPDSPVQIPGANNTDLSPLQPYPYCSPLLIDTSDVANSLGDQTSFNCRVTDSSLAPPSPDGFERRGPLYDVFVFGASENGTRLLSAVTHCIRPDPQDLPRAVFGVASGSPRFWRLLDTQRYNDLICAEVNDVGFMSYFVSTAPPPAPTPTPAK
jgi:hypothetical protein